MITLILVAGFCWVGFAEEEELVHSEVHQDEPAKNTLSANVNYRITTGGLWVWEENCNGGAGEFGINLLPVEKKLMLRNCIFVQGEGGYLNKENSAEGVGFGGIEVGDKILFGGRTNCSVFIIRGYGYFGGALGIFAWENHPFGSKPFIVSLKFGGGFELQYRRNSAFVIEFGGVQRFLAGASRKDAAIKLDKDNYAISAPSLTIGYRVLR